MSFLAHLRGAVGLRALPTDRRVLLLGLAMACVHGRASPARATPLDEPFVGGIGFSGPTTGDLSSVYWNPAALSSITGTEFHFSQTYRRVDTKVERPAIDPATGRPDPGLPEQSFTGEGDITPRPWAPGPGWFAGLGANVLGRFTLAVAAYAPSHQRIRYRPSAEEAAGIGYHGLDVDLRNFALVPALAVRMGKYLHVGLAPGFLFSGGTLTFDEDTAINQGSAGLAADCGGTPCGYENPVARARYRLDAGTSAFPSSPAFTLGGGLHYHRDAWSVGLAYASRPLGNDGAGVRLDVRRGDVLRAPDGPQPSPLCASGRPGACINGELSYRLPDAFIFGVTWRPNERWAWTGVARYQTFSQHDRMVLTLAGPAGSGFGQQGLRSRLVIEHGLQDRVDLRFRGLRSWGQGGRVARAGAGLRLATSAVPEAYLSPSQVDGFTFEPHLMGEVSWKGFSLRAGYAFAFMTSRRVSDSAFDPGAAVACVDARFDFAQPECLDYREGRARPTAAGTYHRTSHSLSLSLLARF